MKNEEMSTTVVMNLVSAGCKSEPSEQIISDLSAVCGTQGLLTSLKQNVAWRETFFDTYF